MNWAEEGCSGIASGGEKARHTCIEAGHTLPWHALPPPTSASRLVADDEPEVELLVLRTT